jgi:GT2 family glycosyltransferase
VSRLSALIVNYDSGAFAVACARSLEREWLAAGRARAELELVVVDNASPHDQRPWLAELEQLGARVVKSRENGGYARGMNQALRETSGGPSDLVLVLNPDLCFLPGSVGELLACLERHPRAGAVAPRAWLDPAQAFELPPNVVPTPCEHVAAALAQVSPATAASAAARRSREAIRVWSSEGDLACTLLSGACVLLPRAAIDTVGGLFDERYPLYFEDTDLCLRLARAGFELWQARDAPIVHHWARSSGVGEEFSGEPARRFAISQRAFYDRWFGASAVALSERCDEFVASVPERLRWRPFSRFESLGEMTDPFEITLSRPARFAIELSLSPLFPLAAGAFGEGAHWRCPPAAWEWFFRGRYFVRALDRDSGECLGAITFDRPTGPRTRPLNLDREVTPMERGARK